MAGKLLIAIPTEDWRAAKASAGTQLKLARPRSQFTKTNTKTQKRAIVLRRKAKQRKRKLQWTDQEFERLKSKPSKPRGLETKVLRATLGLA